MARAAEVEHLVAEAVPFPEEPHLLVDEIGLPYAPQGMPELTVQMGRPDPFNPNDGCGDGSVLVHADALVDKIYNLWNRNPVTVSKAYMTSGGKQDKPPAPTLKSY